MLDVNNFSHIRIGLATADQIRTWSNGEVKKPDQGEILAVGNGKILENGDVRKMDVKVGDRVLFGKYAGQTVKVDGQELLVMREEDIMGVVEA